MLSSVYRVHVLSSVYRVHMLSSVYRVHMLSSVYRVHMLSSVYRVHVLSSVYRVHMLSSVYRVHMLSSVYRVHVSYCLPRARVVLFTECTCVLAYAYVHECVYVPASVVWYTLTYLVMKFMLKTWIITFIWQIKLSGDTSN